MIRLVATCAIITCAANPATWAEEKTGVWIEGDEAVLATGRRLTAKSCTLKIDLPADEMGSQESFKVRLGSTHLDLRHETWGNGVDGEGTGAHEFRRIYFSPKGCSTTWLHESSGSSDDKEDGVFRASANRRPLPSSLELSALAEIGGFAVKPARKEATSPRPHLPRQVAIVAAGWGFRGPVGVASPPVKGVPREFQRSWELRHKGVAYDLEPLARAAPLRAHRAGAFETFVLRTWGRRGSDDLLVRKAGAGSYWTFVPAPRTCDGQIKAIGDRADLVLLFVGFNHPVLAEQSPPCLALLDLRRGRAYAVSLPRNDCDAQGEMGTATSFLARIDKTGLSVRCGSEYDEEEEEEVAAKNTPGKKRNPWPMRLSWKEIEKAAARLGGEAAAASPAKLVR
jgi:hypothetical protein